MKNKSIILILIFIFIGGAKNNVFSQFNPSTNSYDSELDSANMNANLHTAISKNIKMKNVIQCNPNTFWGITKKGKIDEFILVGGVVTFSDSITEIPGVGIAYCNNLDGGDYSPTFYSNQIDTNYPMYYNGWDCTITSTDSAHYNPGGNGNFLYYQGLNAGSRLPKKIDKYDGATFTTIYNRHDRRIACADLAVDNDGNVWFPTSIDTVNSISDSLMVISPTGKIIKQFPFVQNCYNAYGSFILNNVFYLGLGDRNPTNPNTLLPITFTSTSAIIGKPIPMPLPLIEYSDLESCNQGSPLIINENNLLELNISPNPNNGIFTIRQINTTKTEIKIFDIFGKLIYQANTAMPQTTIDLSRQPKGIYFVQITDYNKNFTNRKIIIQ